MTESLHAAKLGETGATGNKYTCLFQYRCKSWLQDEHFSLRYACWPGFSHHEVPIHHLLMKEACQGLKDLSHGIVPYDDHALPLEALREVCGVHCMQVACKRLEHLPKLLHRVQRTGKQHPMHLGRVCALEPC